MPSAFPSLVFNSRFDAVICLDTDQPFKDYISPLGDTVIIAADGAALRLMNHDIKPNYIIGDLDSLSPYLEEELFSSFEIIQIKEQETNDFEKCLVFAQKKGYEKILILGIHGGEMEHTLNNWSVFMRFARQLNLCILDQNRYGIGIFSSFRMKTDSGDLISLIPQPSAVLTTQNLHWNLCNEELSLGGREGHHNIATSGEISIEMHCGSILLFVESRLPYAPSFNADL